MLSIQGRLLNGITTITPRMRYLSLRTWLIELYRSAPEPRPDSNAELGRFGHAAEALFALANMMRDPSTLYVIGRDWAVERLASGQEVIELERSSSCGTARAPAALGC